MKEQITQPNNLIHNTFESYDVFLRKVEEALDKSDYEVNSPVFVRSIFGNQQFDYAEAVKQINIAVGKIKRGRRGPTITSSGEQEGVEDDKIKNQNWINESARRQQLGEERRTGISPEDLNNN
ncbi:hypothetical protein A2331_02800 [Candidatus Falkowbacteria bacterium RIFOXYB2_FULL_34_18]|uniref:Uncharacterized protein n=1 Tax=Candidatus Falkowbacteria bacterium RIFOXYD2_FULL_34_120 TaxID=1798007 RepID=A0A1F5TMC8_9BACT|nr:MAG: hypothetical protein A2331_02800 [Candidatus Falkowbacteria bacterium RIFOXYB2_FULL_34_18]OGF28360.1 MAG: hypothetical protein A2500_03140 [Candidatus Falkowbacteria bacterium RIFOXYC12_FULL_34_55]OGF37921.1 MAG: hypothetical protein A2466_05945 [Candidatus Falkowbacteria bacterium RIFOXYC2_FULL_34_220]OGF39639.1 MAG: hypothetical protein A2515_07240 [Candidatus Falkowbacteria bacterium RIFOXYD12_FULL_34_57]OGF40078.1 MAG: hypothetical protein A2531_04935 [Candidatus Falkowbacteria bact